MKYYENFSLENIIYTRPDGIKDTELWKPITDFEFYAVSNLGRIKSLSRLIIKKCGRNFISKERIMRSNIDKDGYHLVSLRRNGESFKRKRHRLVAEAFIPNPENKPEVHHIKDENNVTDKGNNCYWMIAWNTGEENRDNAMLDGLVPKGEKHHSSRLTDKQVLEIRGNKDNLTHQKLSEIYGVSRPCITDIINRKSWTHLP